jgi:hypothetical protein
MGEVGMRISAFLAVVALAIGVVDCGGSTGSSGSASGTGGAGGAEQGTGGLENCPPCVPPPSPDCVGTGPCGCGPYVCPDGPCAGAACGDSCSTCTGGDCPAVEEWCQADGSCSSAQPDCGGTPICATVSGDYGDCEAELGWGFDGTVCQLYGGCDCGADCAHMFETAAECATACRAAQHCNEDALSPEGIASSFAEGGYCDEVSACVPLELADAVAEVAELVRPCEEMAECVGGVICTLSYGGDVDAVLWDDVCAASLLPEVGVMCLIWGP